MQLLITFYPFEQLLSRRKFFWLLIFSHAYSSSINRSIVYESYFFDLFTLFFYCNFSYDSPGLSLEWVLRMLLHLSILGKKLKSTHQSELINHASTHGLKFLMTVERICGNPSVKFERPQNASPAELVQGILDAPYAPLQKHLKQLRENQYPQKSYHLQPRQ